MRIMNIEDLKFVHVTMIYIPNMWTNDFHYQRTLVETNHYYESSPYLARDDQKNKGLGDSIASSIWMQLDQFRN